MANDLETINEIGNSSEGLISFKNHDNLYGFLDERGNIVIKPIYDFVGDFNGGIAYAQYTQDETMISVYIDKTGKQISKKSYIASKNISEGYGFLRKNNLFLNTISDYIIDKSGKLISLNELHKEFSNPIVDIYNRITIHNGFIKCNNPINMYKITDKGLKKLVFNKNMRIKHIDPFEINPIDNKLYSFIIYENDTYETSSSIIDEDGNIIQSFNNSIIERIDNKFYLVKRFENKNDNFKEKSFDKSFILYFSKGPGIYVNDYPSSIFRYGFDCEVKSFKIINDKVAIKEREVDGKSKFDLILEKNRTSIELFDEVLYEEGYDYIIGLKDNIYYYYDFNNYNNVKLIYKSKEKIIFKNGIGIKKTKEVFDESNISYSYNKYTIYTKFYKKEFDYEFKLSEIGTIPNIDNNIQLYDLKIIDGILFGNSLFNNCAYIINPKNMSKITKIECDKFDYVNGYFIIQNVNGFSLIDKNGSFLYRDVPNIVNIGENKLFISFDNEYEIVEINNEKNIFSIGHNNYDGKIKLELQEIENDKYYDFDEKVFDKLIDFLLSEEDIIIIPTFTSNENYYDKTILIDNKIIINKKDLINRIHIFQDDLFEYVEEDVEVVTHEEKYKDIVLWNETKKEKVKYFKVKDKYKKVLKYFDLKNYNFDNVDVRWCDFSETNAVINPKKVYNKDISGCILNRKNLKDTSVFNNKDYWKDIIQEWTYIYRDIEPWEFGYSDIDKNDYELVLKLED